MKQLVLASQSPRRQALLSQLGYQFSTRVADIDETPYNDEKPTDYVLRLAQQKAQTIFDTLSRSEKLNTLILGADTCVVSGHNILGKPENEQQCINTLQQLSNTNHQVLTSIAVISADVILTDLVITQVSFKPLTLDEIKGYWQTGEPCDKAGSYAIQGIAGQFVTTINGSYSAVVGLPLYETAQILTKLGLATAIQSTS